MYIRTICLVFTDNIYANNTKFNNPPISHEGDRETSFNFKGLFVPFFLFYMSLGSSPRSMSSSVRHYYRVSTRNSTRISLQSLLLMSLRSIHYPHPPTLIQTTSQQIPFPMSRSCLSFGGTFPPCPPTRFRFVAAFKGCVQE